MLARRVILSLLGLVALAGHAPGQTANLGANFQGITLADVAGLGPTVTPPDTMGAVGPNNFVMPADAFCCVKGALKPLAPSKSGTAMLVGRCSTCC